ncbi:MAG: phosphatase PAP2 family protein, partial [Solirubrobacterales bacterium]
GEDREISQQWTTSPALDRIFAPGATMGGGFVQIGGAVGVYVAGRITHHPQTALLGADLIRGQAINALLTHGIKLSVRRTRPDGSSFSFPSGHTSSTFATAAVLQRHFGWKVGVPAYAAAAFVGGSRVQENRHYVSDVLFGAAIGIVSGRTATIGHGRATFAVAPLAAPDRVGVLLTRVNRP